jgi:hypothetical protein
MSEEVLIQQYPPFVVSVDQRERWDAAKGIAEAIMGDAGDEAVWGATRAIYFSPAPT